MLMFVTTTWSEDATIAVVLGFAAFLGGLCQLIAGIFEVRSAGEGGAGAQAPTLKRRGLIAVPSHAVARVLQTATHSQQQVPKTHTQRNC